MAAAREAFAENGFETTTVRAIAARAQVDPAMINHYFGSKEKLFLAAVDAPLDPHDLLETAEPVLPEDVGEHMVRTLLRAWDSPAGVAGQALLRSAFRGPTGAALLREFIDLRILRPMLDRLEPDPVMARWRGSLAASQLGGLALVRYVLRIEPLASAPTEQVVAAVAPQLQHYLTGEVGRPG